MATDSKYTPQLTDEEIIHRRAELRRMTMWNALLPHFTVEGDVLRSLFTEIDALHTGQRLNESLISVTEGAMERLLTDARAAAAKAERERDAALKALDRIAYFEAGDPETGYTNESHLADAFYRVIEIAGGALKPAK